MATIDQLDISVYNLYAVRTQMIERLNESWHIKAAPDIPAQTNIVNMFVPQLNEMDLLLGVVPVTTPWAYFFPPKQFRTRRRSPFSFARIAPSLKSIEEGGEEFIALQSIACETAEEEKEKAMLTSCFKQIGKLNSWLGFIVGRIGQFLQG
ncbi:MAG: DUF5399 family protein [Parachlamydiaceae bacterium]|nr:DUF5399 family protein [Parachlamydiaceae bacterium]